MSTFHERTFAEMEYGEYIQERVNQAIVEEREACAKVAEEWASDEPENELANAIAPAIRARGTQ